MIGRIIGGRYEILQRLGSGGMATVYLANHLLLERKVAVKVLNPEFASDEEFVKRFRREAQAAASLSHPNIVSIYDVGAEGNLHYIVQEYVEGETLKELINREGPLPVNRAVDFAIQISDALACAHRSRIVHRDIKPHNILIGHDGRAKVSDFGIARAAAEATLTHSGAIVGSVHYFAPEQARGSVTDEKSDLYSLGIVLYEMLTGRVPFEGESPISVALRHVQERIPSPRDANPAVPADVERIVMLAAERDPAKRYQSAPAVLVDLRRAARGLPPIVAAPGNSVEQEEKDFLLADGNTSRSDRHKRPQYRASRKTWVIAGAVVTVILGFFLVRGLIGFFNPGTVEVPPVVGKSLLEAQQILTDAKLNYVVVAESFSELPANSIYAQDPAPPRVVRPGRVIKLWQSKGPETVVGGVPDVVGKTSKEAELILRGVGLEVTINLVTSDSPVDYVVNQNPRATSTIRKGERVEIDVSQGPAPTGGLPSFVGERIENVRIRLAELGLSVGRQSSAPGAKDVIVGQSPVPGTPLVAGMAVDLTVGDGTAVGPRTTTVTFTVPGGPDTRPQVTLYVIDSVSTRKVDDTYRSGGDSVSLTVTWTPPTAKVQWLVNGTVVKEQDLR